ncbi:MAG: hypothetical protein AAGA56_27795 [Myxococcota bacterium]
MAGTEPSGEDALAPPTTSRRIPQRSEPPPPPDDPIAQQRALAAARLKTPEEEQARASYRRSIAAATATGVVVGVVGVAVYAVAWSPEPRVGRAPPVATPERPISSAEEAPPTHDVAKTVVAAASADAVASAAPEGDVPPPPTDGELASRSLSFTPPFAGVLLDGKPRRDANGSLVIEGEIGSRHNLILTVQGQSRSYLVIVTEDGLKPDTIRFSSRPSFEHQPTAGSDDDEPPAAED